MTYDIPHSCKAYCFSQNGELKREEVGMEEVREHEVLIKVHACNLSSCDHITQQNLLHSHRHERIPGVSVVGEVVKVGHNVQKLKEGMKVCAVTMYGGLSEYTRAEGDCCLELNKQEYERTKECCVASWNAARIHCAFERFENLYSSMGREQRQSCEKHCEEAGFQGEGVICIYGEGGYARLAIQMLKAMQQHNQLGNFKKCRIVLITPTERWNHDKYDMDKKDVLCIEKCDLAEELRKLGGVWWCCATDMPTKGVEQLFEGMRFNSQLVVLNPHYDTSLELPIGQIIAKNISIAGAPTPLTHDLRRCLDLCEKGKVRPEVECVRFEDEGRVRELWKEVEKGKRFEAPVVEMRQGQ